MLEYMNYIATLFQDGGGEEITGWLERTVLILLLREGLSFRKWVCRDILASSWKAPERRWDTVVQVLLSHEVLIST